MPGLLMKYSNNKIFSSFSILFHVYNLYPRLVEMVSKLYIDKAVTIINSFNLTIIN
jgi:hypothetical protein